FRSSRSCLMSLYCFGAFPWRAAASALLFFRMESSTFHNPMHFTFGCFNAFDSSPKPILRHPISPIRILSFAEWAGAVCAENGEARIPDIPAAAMHLDESARNSRREDLCSSIIIYRGTNKRRDAKCCASVICLASLQGPGLVALLVVDAAFIAARHRHVTQ